MKRLYGTFLQEHFYTEFVLVAPSFQYSYSFIFRCASVKPDLNSCATISQSNCRQIKRRVNAFCQLFYTTFVVIRLFSVAAQSAVRFKKVFTMSMSTSGVSSDSVKLNISESGSRGDKSPVKSSSSKGTSSEIPPSVWRSLAFCFLYGTTSVSITFFNKAIFSVYEFRFPCIVTLAQIMVCITMLTLAQITGFVSLPRITKETSRQVYPLTIVWWVYVVSGIAALRYLTIPMFSTLRKSTAMIVLILEAVLLRKRARPSVWVAILIMVGGGFIAGATDLSFSTMGYFLVSLCCLATALYLVLIVRVTNSSKLGTFALLYYNNVLALPLMLGYLVFFTKELEDVKVYPFLYDKKFILFFLFSAAQATLLNIAIFLCTKLNSPLATTVTGQMKDFVTVGFGLFVFGDVKLSVPNLVGLAISLLGSVVYSVIKLISARAQAKNVSEQSK